MIRYKIDIIKALKEVGYNTNRIRIENLMSQSTLQKMRTNNTSIVLDSIDIVCKLLNCQPGDILEYVPGVPNTPGHD